MFKFLAAVRRDGSKILKDISNLYASRDGLWKELFKLQATSKRRHKELLGRIHHLECELKKHVKPRGTYEAFKSYQKEETGQASIENRERNVNLW